LREQSDERDVEDQEVEARVSLSLACISIPTLILRYPLVRAARAALLSPRTRFDFAVEWGEEGYVLYALIPSSKADSAAIQKSGH
jgi:hypothetical protein